MSAHYQTLQMKSVETIDLPAAAQHSKAVLFTVSALISFLSLSEGLSESKYRAMTMQDSLTQNSTTIDSPETDKNLHICLNDPISMSSKC